MGKVYRYPGNRSNQWRKHTGAKRYRWGSLAGVPMRLVFVTAAAIAAYTTQFVMQHGAVLQGTISSWTEPLPDPIDGRASIIDGDTVEIAGQRIRFNGIDAPESRQYCDDAKGFEYPCGRRAAQALDEFLAASRPLHCSFVERDRYGRLVGNCERADGVSVQRWLVEQGLALDWPRYSNGAFAAEQGTAKAAHRGVWQGRFDQPWDWRAGHSDDPQPAISQPLGIVGSGQVAQSYSCQPRRYCAQVGSCAAAQWYLHNCSWGRKLDADGDGKACETLC